MAMHELPRARRRSWCWIIAILVIGVPVVCWAERPDWAAFSVAGQAGPGIANHPVGVKPTDSVRIPSGWPLDSAGSITCKTCHYDLPFAGGSRGDSYLRDSDAEAADPTEFCRKCHVDEGRADRASMHWMAVRVAHVMANQDRVSGPRGALDDDSRQCLGCHDGVTAPETSYTTPWNRDAGSFGDKNRNHPVGVRYPSLAPRGHSVPFRPVGLLPKAIQLPGGTVSCVSCHDLYARNPAKLAVPIEGSQLCMTCHQMD